jgi:hypothetical protein
MTQIFTILKIRREKPVNSLMSSNYSLIHGLTGITIQNS